MRAGRIAAGAALAAAACGIAVQRDLSSLPVNQVVYDDSCGLQGYFDALALGHARPPRVVRSRETERQGRDRPIGGQEAFVFEGTFLLENARRVLAQNWKRLPEGWDRAPRLELEVDWAEKAGVRRVVTTRSAALILGDERHTLPYHVCLSELLYGAPLYRTRHEVLFGAVPPELLPRTDAGAADGGADGRPAITPP